MSDLSRKPARARGASLLYDREDHLTRTDLWAWQEAVRRVETGGAVGTSQDDIVGAMRRPEFYGAGEQAAVEMCETHISWVFLIGDRAFKLKKAVVLPFLDYGSAERRRLMCEREVSLNAPLAGDIYIGVRTIVSRRGRLALGPPGDAGAIDHVVEMRRYDESRTLAALVAAERIDADALAKLGGEVARFHAGAAIVTDGPDPLVALKTIGDGNFESLLGSGDVLERERVVSAQRFVDAFLSGRAATLLARAGAGRVRSGHGDLRAEHILIGADGTTRIVDCAEFDATLRDGDVAGDIAFLFMDLMRLGRADLAARFVDGYRAGGGDCGDDALVALHAAVKSWVRAKVALLRASEGGPAREGAEAQARQLFALGERLAWRARLPLALVVCGAPASGKSTLAAALGASSGLDVISSDLIRKEMAGIDAHEHAGDAAYTAAAGAQTYRELGRRAAAAAQRYNGVIVDATFGQASFAADFATAFAAAAPVMFCECRAPLDVLLRRARARMSDPARVSDARPAIAAQLAEGFEPLENAVGARSHVVLRSDQPLEDLTGDLLAALDRHLEQSPDLDGTVT